MLCIREFSLTRYLYIAFLTIAATVCEDQNMLFFLLQYLFLFIYLLQLGFHPVTVVSRLVRK